ncbi:hypothetical protein EVAR_101981_1 [Eumeta japonica]|uniref:Uncharacterized protein n=1 Tax=Eumeta variegata TaxID=151549 RepID=A0A4C1TSI1_EUMVA|nr:hypothetical protein EVAR_101981_1 [Eumeta japonica]
MEVDRGDLESTVECSSRFKDRGVNWEHFLAKLQAGVGEGCSVLLYLDWRAHRLRLSQNFKVFGIDDTFSFGAHAREIGERAVKCFGKMTRVSSFGRTDIRH